MARAVFSFSGLRSAIFSGSLCRSEASKLNHNFLLLIQSRGKRDGNLDVNTWDGEKFVRATPRNHQETPIYPGLYTGAPPPKGKIYDKKPFRIQVEAGKVYQWCSCGHSKTQPFCDNTHWKEEGTGQRKFKPRFRPVKYVAKETKTVYFCNCKQTNNRPFCDNTHRNEEIQEGISIFRN